MVLLVCVRAVALTFTQNCNTILDIHLNRATINYSERVNDWAAFRNALLMPEIARYRKPGNIRIVWTVFDTVCDANASSLFR